MIPQGFKEQEESLSWLKEKEPISADKRLDVVREFVELHRYDEKLEMR